MTCPFLGFLHIVSKDKIQSIYNQPYVLVLNRKLLTNGERYRLHLSVDPYCAICAGHLSVDPYCAICAGLVEDELHVLRDCCFVKGPLEHDLIVCCWKIWERRNKWIFGDEHISIYGTLQDIMSLASAIHEPNCIGLSMRAYGGGLLRNMKVNGSHVFVSNFGSCSVLNAELWAMLEGLYLAKGQGVSHLLIECDNTVAVQLVQGQTQSSGVVQKLVLLIQNILNSDSQCQVVHVYREANWCADYLSKFAGSFSFGSHFLQDPPHGLCQWIMHDSIGVAYPRLCIST
ncbi:uncharacterized protein LOC119370866 [Jatropha curcas]|uniref:uncharacterized protein LOC119370866 n=1 Tax=Jatropha curcas TaxID=180498 RepID=UPI001896144E|nr:uncharacterized protein LOC119370866 [Jatropha curcas]